MFGEGKPRKGGKVVIRIEFFHMLGRSLPAVPSRPAPFRPIVFLGPKEESLKKPRLLLSVLNDTNDYQVEQVKVARQACARVGADLEVVYAEDDGVLQSQQLLQRIQSPTEPVPDVIMFEPAGSTTLPQVARAAAGAGIGWVILSRDAEYIPELRSNSDFPVFAVASDHQEIGRSRDVNSPCCCHEGELFSPFKAQPTAGLPAFAQLVCWKQNPETSSCGR